MSRSRGRGRIRVLVVEDSPTVRDLLVHILSADAEIAVIGTAKDGEDAVEAVKRWQPNVITMDIQMPKMNGLEATRKIMETCPTPIVIVSSTTRQDEVAGTYSAIEAGALAVAEKPNGIDHPVHEEAARQLIQTVKLMSEIKVVRRWPKQPAAALAAPVNQEIEIKHPHTEFQLVAIGASTGGPNVLKTILSGLRKDFSVPILVVQHIATGFTSGFAEWLAQSSGVAVHIASHAERPLPGHAYVAPDGLHMTVAPGGTIALAKDRPENGHCPSVSRLFRSVALVMGRNAIGVLLTGMGKDGAEELKLMKDKGAVTIAQDEETSIIHGMPGEAINLGGTTYVLSPNQISVALGHLVT